MELLQRRVTFVLEDGKRDYVSPVGNSAGVCGLPRPAGSIAPPLRIVAGERGDWSHVSNLS